MHIYNIHKDFFHKKYKYIIIVIIIIVIIITESLIAIEYSSLYNKLIIFLLCNANKIRYKKIYTYIYILGVQLRFRRFPIDGFSGKWWSK